MKNKVIYLDNAASTSVRKEVVEEMEKVMLPESLGFGNSSSIHSLGEAARTEIEDVRSLVSRELGAKASDIIFTSGATESNNLALQGVVWGNTEKRRKIVVSEIEHESILELSDSMKKQGYDFVKLKTGPSGFMDLERLRKEVDSNTLIVSIGHVNSEIGCIQNLEEISKICRDNGAYFHTDATQSFGKLDIDLETLPVDLLSASGHKIGGPKGSGFLFVRQGTKVKPLIYGGGQEFGLRSGTENVPGIVGIGKALELSKKINKEKIGGLQKFFIEELEKIGGSLNGPVENRIYNNVNVSFPNVEGDSLVVFLSGQGIMCSTRSACSSNKSGKSEVLKAIGVPKKYINGALRFTLNEDNTKSEIEKVIRELKKTLGILRV